MQYFYPQDISDYSLQSYKDKKPMDSLQNLIWDTSNLTICRNSICINFIYLSCSSIFIPAM